MDNGFDLKFMSDEELRNAMDEFIDSVKDDVAADEAAADAVCSCGTKIHYKGF